MTHASQAARPARLIVVVGTGTGVGKTWAAARLLTSARARGLHVAARKPVQSFEPGSGATDAELLAAASGEHAEAVCPRHRWYAVPMAPPMATECLGLPAVWLEDLVAEVAWPQDVDLGVLETVGGLRSPLAEDADSFDLLRRCAPDEVLLVADAGLGTLNSVRLALGVLAPYRTTVLLNRFDPNDDLQRRNRDWLRSRDGVETITRVEALLDGMQDQGTPGAAGSRDAGI
ncbi:MAG: hypothetical protein DIU71_15230 [Proteobacteria bacterium]|nr:MAG: hypothetical protein DIU71_15230 [Pseudomonadota bacterium]